MKGMNGVEVTARTDYNEYLTKEENEMVHRELFWSAEKQLDLDEQELDRSEKEMAELDKELAELDAELEKTPTEELA